MPYPVFQELQEGMNMAEVIARRSRRRTDRWMPRTKRVTGAQIRKAALFLLRCLPGGLLAFADVMGIPSGFHAALGAAMAAAGMDVRPVLAGGAGALLLRLLSGLPPRWELLITLALIYVSPLLLKGRGNWALALYTAAAMLPTAVVATFQPTAAEMLLGWSCVPLSALAAPVMARAVRSLKGGRNMSALEERLAVGFLAALCLCGGARMLLLGVNVGALLSAALVNALALVLGVGAGALGGMLAGVMLAMQGLPLEIGVALSMGGFLCGIAQMLGNRRLSCGAFAVGAYLPLLLCGARDLGVGTAVLASALAIGLLPRAHWEPVQAFLRRFMTNDPAPGDAYAASALAAWEKTVAAMARAVPSPQEGEAERTGAWWEEKLCQGCPECELCGCLLTDLGQEKAETVWEYRFADEKIWQDALEHLRGMGCKRLYYLIEAMNALRREDEVARMATRQAEMQRDMLVTHLMAMSGAARRFAALSCGENWWDHMAAKRISRALAERAVPMSLSYVRRVQGHAQAALELHVITGARKQAEDICGLVSSVLETPMQLASLDGDRILLTERPLLLAEAGRAEAAAEDGAVCGDTAWTGILADGRFLAALSDGMGHGQRAALSSRQTVELMRLCLDAGYTRAQTLTAVNGMMLLGGGGERFATADVLTIDLWKGQSALDKLGAASSWLYRKGELTRLTGDALPLGIIEDVAGDGACFQLAEGDAVILLTDGVEDAFSSVSALETAVRTALTCSSPRKAAESLLASALEAGGGQRRDDQSTLFVYIRNAAETALQASAAGV